MSDFFSSLNETQQDAVRTTEGPCLVIAGAGSGKTRVLTYRIAYLLSKGVPSYRILALTFTNKAAAEMKERVVQLVGTEAAMGLQMGTFHSIFSRILRIEAASVPGFDTNYTILDTDDVKKLLSQVVEALHLDKDIYKAHKVATRISKAKNDIILPDEYPMTEMFKMDKLDNMPAMADVYATYWNRCRSSNSMDFDDLLLQTGMLFQRNPIVLQKYQHLFQYILVDEYQDTNLCQYNIVKMLALPENNLCVVGDDAQSIYSFRGANIENILRFSKQDYPQAKLFKLEQNYRSTQTIVNAANSVISKNKYQIHKTVFSDAEEGDRIPVIEAKSDAEEGIKVAESISQLIERGENYSDIAILYRTNAQSRIIEEALHKKRIPCKVVKGTSFFQRKEVKDVISYVRVAVNPKDEVSLLRILNYPARAIGATTRQKIVDIAHQQQVPVWVVLSNIEKLGTLIPATARNKIMQFVYMMESFRADLRNADAYSLMNRIIEKIQIKESLYKEYSSEDAGDRFNNIQELLNGAKEFVENELDPEQIYIQNYLEKIALLTDIDEENTENPHAVLLMTVHAAKGLEFKHCFLIGMMEEVFPSSLSSQNPKNLEEERRLFYVALTRAMKTVTISYSWSRRVYGSLQGSTPSRFLTDIDSRFLSGTVAKQSSSSIHSESAFSSYRQNSSPSFSAYESASKSKFSRYSESSGQKHFSGWKQQNQMFAGYNKPTQQTSVTFVASKPEDIQVGRRVNHNKFGEGVVISRDGDGPNLSAIIRFDNWGEKRLLLKYAKLQVLEN